MASTLLSKKLRGTRKFFLVNLGCPKNLIDSENLSLELIKRGFEPVQDPDSADAIIINTCGFIEDARKMSQSYANEFSKFRKFDKKLIVLGCYPKRIGIEKAKRKIPADFVFLDWKDLIDAFDSITQIGDSTGRKMRFTDGTGRNFPLRINTLSPFSAYLKISEGCSRSCSFCSIPLIRGALKSRPEEEILSEARYLADSGVKELIRVSQDTTMWGVDMRKKREDFLRLLDKLSQIDGIAWIRLLYIYPDSFAEKLIDYIAQNNKIVRYIEIPFQHIDDQILKNMGRVSRESNIRAIIERIKEKIPDMAIRTELIVGFPGETDEKFIKLVEFVKEYKFDWLGVFTFSPEPQTASFNMWKIDRIPKKVKEERKNEIMRVWSEILEEKQKSRVGTTLRCIYESETSARAYFQAPESDGFVKLRGTASKTPFINVKIVDFEFENLIGEVL